jgi:hypothetical protein
MQRRGKTTAGSQRWYCAKCDRSAIRKRQDNCERTRLFLFVRWLTGKTSLVEIAKEYKVSIKTVRRWFVSYWQSPPKTIPSDPVRVLVLDGTSVVFRVCMLLIAGDADQSRPVDWLAVERESHGTWLHFLTKMRNRGIMPTTVICDGQRGLLKAIPTVWPEAKVQRCLIHVIRQASIWLTQHPKTDAGRELLCLVRLLTLIRTRRQKRRWVRSFNYWRRRHYDFLKEKSYGPGKHWWYTHRKLRGVRSLLANAIPDLFRFVSDPTIPRTSNHVEGGMNSRIKELFCSHRGLSVQKKIVLASWYLRSRQLKKPPRNVH